MSEQGKSKKRGKGSRPFLKLFSLSTGAALLVIGLITPAVVVAGLSGTAVVSIFDKLPDVIRPVNAAQTSTIYAMQDGKPVKVADFFNENRISVGYDQLSPNLIHAVVDTEDPRFFQHGGVDWVSLVRATFQSLLKGGDGPGGSTITMQYVKNTLLEQAVLSGDAEAIALQTDSAHRFQRKLQEVRFALALEKTTSKQDILAGYLNLSYFGTNVSGVEAASQYYFAKHAADLTVPEAAMIAAMLKGAEAYRPDIADNAQRAKDRRNYVIDNMVKAGDISAAEGDTYKASPIVTHITKVPVGCEADQTTAFFCDYVVWTIRNSSEFGPTMADRENLLRRGGLDIYTTMDLKLQRVADRATKAWVPPTDKSQIGSASVSVQVGTGHILAMTENRIYDQSPNAAATPGHTSVNYSSDKAYGGSSGFQTGSTYKIFTLADWLINGHHLMDHVDGRVHEYNAADFSARCGTLLGTWAPNNIGKEPEDLSVVEATALSVNTAFANMASKLDLCDIRDIAQSFGVHRADGTPLLYVPSSILGVNEIAPLTMAAAQAGVANKGVFCTPIAISSVHVRTTNTELQVPQSVCSKAVEPDIAAGMTYAMQRVISGGTGGASSTGDGTPLAGKTGTTDNGVHTWMTGFSTAVATATWVGNVSGTTSLKGILLHGKAGNTVRHDIWRTIMQTADKEYPGKPFDAPPQSMIDATMITVPVVSGTVPDTAAQTIEQTGLNAKILVNQIASSQPAGTVAYTLPKAGSVIPIGTQVKVYVSRGGLTRVPSVAGMSVADAKTALLNAGFSAVSEPVHPSQDRFFVHSSTVPAGSVVGTSPAAGSAIDSASAILLIISTGP
jgi:membrane peptidoglycan carboxypeptidase